MYRRDGEVSRRLGMTKGPCSGLSSILRALAENVGAAQIENAASQEINRGNLGLSEC